MVTVYHGDNMSDSDEYRAFTSLVDKLLTVPKESVKKRMEAYQKAARQNESRPGPKPKPKPAEKPTRKKRASSRA
jgi:hypothetical protein